MRAQFFKICATAGMYLFWLFLFLLGAGFLYTMYWIVTNLAEELHLW